MKIEEVEDLWAADCKIDKSDLDGESLKIPQLHHKYYKIYIREKINLTKKNSELNILVKDKSELYMGKLDQRTLQEKGWQQFDLKILKNDLDLYLEADQDIIKFKIELALQKEKVVYLEDIIRNIANRSFQISNAIKYLAWTQGEG